MQILTQIKNPKIQKLYLKHLSKQSCIYNALHEIGVNFTANKIPLTSSEVKKLKKYKRLFRRLSKRSKNKAEQSKQVVQAGGAFPLLIPILASLGGSIAGKIVDHVASKIH